MSSFQPRHEASSLVAKINQNQVDRVAAQQGSSCNSGSAKTASPGNKLSGKASKNRRKSRQPTLPAATANVQTHFKSNASLSGLAESMSNVSAFCQAALSKIIPHEFWGVGGVQEHNHASFLRKVDSFIKLRRFETISLHEVMQGFKVRQALPICYYLFFVTIFSCMLGARAFC